MTTRHIPTRIITRLSHRRPIKHPTTRRHRSIRITPPNFIEQRCVQDNPRGGKANLGRHLSLTTMRVWPRNLTPVSDPTKLRPKTIIRNAASKSECTAAASCISRDAKARTKRQTPKIICNSRALKPSRRVHDRYTSRIIHIRRGRPAPRLHTRRNHRRRRTNRRHHNQHHTQQGRYNRTRTKRLPHNKPLQK
ncbi:unannotated protein [freshwater metagenome]|uniref:Unannotated protein n=1 Tax=freshwater metagenome TaxID=449393 RepID=A0A6J7NK50_9ZZZZ